MIINELQYKINSIETAKKKKANRYCKTTLKYYKIYERLKVNLKLKLYIIYQFRNFASQPFIRIVYRYSENLQHLNFKSIKLSNK